MSQTKKARDKIFLDYNSATPLAPEVLSEMLALEENFANPASVHRAGQEAENLLESSRETIGDFLDARAREIIFTSGGTEGNNTVLWQALCPQNKRIKRVIISEIEHPSISEYADFLELSGVDVLKIPVNEEGFCDLDFLAKNVNEHTLVSVIWANNEIGTVQDTAKIAEIVKGAQGLLHFDGVQAFGKLKISMKETKADFLTFSSHKIYGPRAIGGLFVREGAPFFPLIMGGGQETGFRAGTGNQILAAGFAKATQLCANLEREEKRIWALRQGLAKKLEEEISPIKYNGAQKKAQTLAGTLSMTFPDAENEIVTLRLDNENIFVSKGSACSSKKVASSATLTAIGLSPSASARTIRVSLGRQTDENEIECFSQKLTEIVKNLRKNRNSV